MPNFKLTQDWVGYLDRTYQQIKASLVARLTSVAPEITDHTESNPLIIIISMFSGVAEMLNLYIDRMAQESFLGTARRYSSVLKLVKLIDYRVKASLSAQADITFTLYDTVTDLPVNAVNTITIPLATQVNSLNSIAFYTDEAGTIPAGSSSVVIPVSQYETTTNGLLGNTTGLANLKIELGFNYVHQSLSIVINGVTWNEISSLGLAVATDKVFIVEIEEDSKAYVYFGDGVNGEIPANGYTVFGTYRLTFGSAGNFPPDSINELISTITVPASTELRVTNNKYSYGGTNYEGIDDIRNLAPRSIRTLHRAVTYQDFLDLAVMAPGVSSAELTACCGSCLKLYIAPKTRGIATTPLLNSVKDYFDCKRMVGTCLEVYPAGLTRVWVNLTITGKYGYVTTAVESDFLQALDDNYGYDASWVNRPIKISDLTALIDNLVSVESLNIDNIWAEPYARPDDGVPSLDWTPVILSGSTQREQWKVIYDDVNLSFIIFKNGVPMPSNALVGVPWSDPDGIIQLTFHSNPYTARDNWEFVTYPIGQDLIIDDKTVPIIDVILSGTGFPGFLDYTINPTTSSAQCRPNC